VSDPTDNDEERLNTDLTFEQLVKKVVHAEAEPDDTDAADDEG
jgi:hypothetical protein